MRTAAIDTNPKTKKLIELPNDVCRKLAVQAAAMGTSVKRLIETLVISSIADSDDDALYAYMLETRPDGSVPMAEEEQSELLNRLRAKAAADEV